MFVEVPPAELEDLLLSHNGVQDAAVIGIPDKQSGELPRAFIVRRDPTLTETTIADFVKSTFLRLIARLIANLLFI
jgi:acyl-CoA synthetase (AMP-forming)/AMP-acid ligase II